MAAQLTELDRTKIMADYHAGINQNQLATKYDVSKATINKLCKGVTPINLDKINTLVRIEAEFMDLEPYSERAARRELDKKLRDLAFFRDASLAIARRALKNMEDSQNISMFELEKAQNIMGKGKENIYGKSPETAVQINNTAAMPKAVDLTHLTLKEKLDIKRKVFGL